MSEDYKNNQIIRKDAKNCFVESLNDSFPIGKAHFGFASYDMSKPAGSRQTNRINIYISVEELLELCRKLSCGELKYMFQSKKKASDSSPLYQCLGGTSAERLKKMGKSRNDGMSLSRTAQIICGSKCDILFVADSGPGEENEKGLIVPRFGNKPENHVAVSMTFYSLSELLLMTKTHYEAWLSAYYAATFKTQSNSKPKQNAESPQSFNSII